MTGIIRKYYCRKCGEFVVSGLKEEFCIKLKIEYRCKCGEEGKFDTGKFEEEEISEKKRLKSL